MCTYSCRSLPALLEFHLTALAWLLAPKTLNPRPPTQYTFINPHDPKSCPTLTVRSLSTSRLGDFKSRWMMGGRQVCR